MEHKVKWRYSTLKLVAFLSATFPVHFWLVAYLCLNEFGTPAQFCLFQNTCLCGGLQGPKHLLMESAELSQEPLVLFSKTSPPAVMSLTSITVSAVLILPSSSPECHGDPHPLQTALSFEEHGQRLCRPPHGGFSCRDGSAPRF